MNPRMRLAASAAVIATIAGVLGASAAPATAATCGPAPGVLTGRLARAAAFAVRASARL